MSGSYLDQAAVVSPPGTGTQKNILANTAAPTAIDLAAFAGGWINVKATVKCHVRFTSTSTATTVTTTDWYLTPDLDYTYYIPAAATASGSSAKRYLKFKGAGTVGKLHVVGSSDSLDGN